MINTASNFETLKQRMATSPQDSFFKGKLSRIYEVLIVDDEEPFVLSLADGLSTYKKYFHVRTAPNGAEAVKILKLSPVDLVITDLSMPKMDGFELLAYMNRNYPKIPVILMTAYGTPKIEEIVGNMGIFRYLEKPLDINAVADNIVDALGIKISITETKAQGYNSPDISHRPADTLGKAFVAKTSAEITKAQEMSDTEDRSKTVATFGSRTTLDLEKIREGARIKAAGKGKEYSDKKSVPDAEKRAIEAAEKRAILEAKAKAEAERFAREEAERKAQEAEEKARQEAMAREEAERKVREAEERVERARQEALAREETIKRAKAEAEERARQEALAREEAIKKVKAEAEAEEKARRETLAREEAERKARETEEKARQEALAKEEALKKEKAEAEEKARRETLAREEAERKAREAEQRDRREAQAENDKKQNDLKSETRQKLSAWKKS